MTPRQKLTGLFTQISDVKAIGLPGAQGLLLTEAFYWDRDDASRAFARRFAEKMPGRVPTENQAGVYSSVLAFLHAVRKADTLDGDKVVAAMRAAPIEDPLFGTVTVRPDGRGGARHARVPGEDAGGVKVRVGPLQAGIHHSGRPGLPSAERGRLSPGQVTATPQARRPQGSRAR